MVNGGACYEKEKHSREKRSGGNRFRLGLFLFVIQAEMSKNAMRYAGLGVFQNEALG